MSGIRSTDLSLTDPETGLNAKNPAVTTSPERVSRRIFSCTHSYALRQTSSDHRWTPGHTSLPVAAAGAPISGYWPAAPRQIVVVFPGSMAQPTLRRAIADSRPVRFREIFLLLAANCGALGVLSCRCGHFLTIFYYLLRLPWPGDGGSILNIQYDGWFQGFINALSILMF